MKKNTAFRTNQSPLPWGGVGGGLLFLELVVITVVAWAVFDPAVVNLYYRSLPLGYDSSQLLYAETEVNGSWNEVVDGVPQDPYEMTEKRLDKIMRQLTSVEGVESAYLYEQEFGAVGYSRPAFNECVVGGDTLYLANWNGVLKFPLADLDSAIAKEESFPRVK